MILAYIEPRLEAKIKPKIDKLRSERDEYRYLVDALCVAISYNDVDAVKAMRSDFAMRRIFVNDLVKAKGTDIMNTLTREQINLAAKIYSWMIARSGVSSTDEEENSIIQQAARDAESIFQHTFPNEMTYPNTITECIELATKTLKAEGILR